MKILEINLEAGSTSVLYTIPYSTSLTLEALQAVTEIESAIAYLKLRNPNDERIAAIREATISIQLDEVHPMTVSPSQKQLLLTLKYQYCLRPESACFGAYELVLFSIATQTTKVVASVPFHQVNLLSHSCQRVFVSGTDDTLIITDTLWSLAEDYMISVIGVNNRNCGDGTAVNQSLLFTSLNTSNISRVVGEGVSWHLSRTENVLTFLNRECSNEGCRHLVESATLSPTDGQLLNSCTTTLKPDVRPFVDSFTVVGDSVLFFGRDTNSGEFPRDGFGVVNASSNPNAADLQRIPYDAPEVPKRLIAASDGQSAWAHTVSGAIWKATITADNKVQYREFYPEPVLAFIPSADGSVLIREGSTRYAVVSPDGVKLYEVDVLSAIAGQANAPANLSEDMIVAVSW